MSEPFLGEIKVISWNFPVVVNWYCTRHGIPNAHNVRLTRRRCNGDVVLP